MKKYCVIVKYENEDVKNVCKDLSICYWGDGCSDDYCFDSNVEALEVLEAYKKKLNADDPFREFLEIEVND